MLLSAPFSVFVLTQEKSFVRGFILKPAERAYVPQKNGVRDFQNSPSFDRWACFYVTITENFERFWNFDNFNFETNVLKNENLFQKTAVPFLVESTKIESAKIESATPFQKSM